MRSVHPPSPAKKPEHLKLPDAIFPTGTSYLTYLTLPYLGTPPPRLQASNHLHPLINFKPRPDLTTSSRAYSKWGRTHFLILPYSLIFALPSLPPAASFLPVGCPRHHNGHSVCADAITTTAATMTTTTTTTTRSLLSFRHLLRLLSGGLPMALSMSPRSLMLT